MNQQQAVVQMAATTSSIEAGSDHSSQPKSELQTMNPPSNHHNIHNNSHSTTLNMPPSEVPNAPVASKYFGVIKFVIGVLSFLWCILFTFVLAILNILLTLLPWVFILVLRLLQFFLNEQYEQLTVYKCLLRLWMCFNLVILLIFMSVIYPIVRFVPSIRLHVLLIGLPITEWVQIICILCGFYLFNFVVSAIIAFYMANRRWLHLTTWGVGHWTEVYEAISEGIGCLLFWWAESEVIMKRVPTFEHHQILGVRFQKWIEVPVIIILGYNITRVTTYVIVWLMIWRANPHMKLRVGPENKFDSMMRIKKRIVYFSIRKWMRRSITFLLTSILGLLVWVLHLGPKPEHTEASYESFLAFDLVTRTWICILICSLLWLAKSCILVAWEANAVFNRLTVKIFEAGKLFYFLGNFGKYYKFERWWINTLIKDRLFNNKNDPQVCTLYDLFQVAQYLLEAKDELSKETYTRKFVQRVLGGDVMVVTDDDGDVSSHLMEYISKRLRKPDKDASNSDVSKDVSKLDNPASITDWNNFKKLLKKVEPSEQTLSNRISKKEFEIWAEGARKSCLFMANTLHSAKEVSDCLNKIISVLVIAGILLLWLLLTGFATTKVLVLIATTIFSANFIFGESCKNAFQGIMFVYVIQPFSVGDLCVIDDKMMVVDTVGVWKTTFSKVDTQGEVIYTNSNLANKVVVNYKTEFDWNDCLEFKIGTMDNNIMDNLIKGIKDRLNEEKDKFIPDHHSIEALATGDGIKLVVLFKYKIRDRDWTFFDCLQYKQRLRSEFSLHIQNLVQKLKENACERP